MKSICNKIWNFLDFLILKNFSKFLENSREISLLDLDLEAFSIHFSLSISILRHFHFTFHSRSRYQGIFISLFILEMSEPDFHFTFHFSKWVNQISISLFTSRTSNIHSRRTLGQTYEEMETKIHFHFCNRIDLSITVKWFHSWWTESLLSLICDQIVLK